MTDEISTGLSYGNVNSIYTDFGTAFPLSIGRKVARIASENGSIYLKYNPARGPLKGFSANVGVTHVGETPVEQPNAGDTYTTNSSGQRVLTRTTYQWRLTVPSATLWNPGVRYTLRRSRVNQTLGINLHNITDRDYLRCNRLLSERRAIYFTYSIATGDKRR